MAQHVLNDSNERINPATEDSLAVLTTTPAAKTLTDCRQFVAAAGTAEALVASETFCRKVVLQAKKAAADNTGNVFVGISDLDGGVKEYLELAPGDYWEFEMPAGTKLDLNTVYVDADTNDDGVVGFYVPA